VDWTEEDDPTGLCASELGPARERFKLPAEGIWPDGRMLVVCTAETVDATEGSKARDHDSDMMVSVEGVFADRTRSWGSGNWASCCAHRAVNASLAA
jgi:hypothetical protein